MHNFHRLIALICGPALFLLILQIPENQHLGENALNVLALAAWMVCWWVFEAVPIPVTALLPMIILPLTGVFELAEATSPYASPIIFLFLGGFMVALGIEQHNLHKRIALTLLSLIGTTANGIILGFMIATALLSMWISNTATTIMMLPISLSVVQVVTEGSEHDFTEKEYRKFAMILMLAIAYSANIGGAMTLIGTPPNIVLAGYMDQFYGYSLDFSTWLLFGVPFGIIMLGVLYLLLTRFVAGKMIKNIGNSHEVIKNELHALGKIKKEELLVITIFATTAFCWIFKNVINNLLGSELLNDTLIAMIGGMFMFITPIKLTTPEFLLDWNSTKRLPWGILLLFGGGLCLAAALEGTGIIQLIEHAIVGYQHWISAYVLILILIIITLLFTELMGNVAMVSIFLPVVFAICNAFGLSPLLAAIPVTVASSCAFMMPVSTPPNAIVFGSGYIRIKDMVKAGVFLNILTVPILFLLAIILIEAAIM